VPFDFKETPALLAYSISFARKITGSDYYRAGLLLIPIFAGLFIFPLFFYASRLGFGLSAILGGLIGSLGHAYYDRTGMGRIDTDLLNTFFPLAVASFILAMEREKTWRANILLAMGAGISMYLYCWWYPVAAFILVYLLLILLYLLLGRVPWKQIVLVLPVFLLLAGPQNVMQSIDSLQTFLYAYVSPRPSGQIAWPNIMKTISEAKQFGIMVKLQRLHGFLPIVLVGFAGLLYLCFRRFRYMIPAAPMLGLGAWSLAGGPIRFVLYLGPFIGVGVGVVIELLARYIGKKMRLKPLWVSFASALLMFGLFFSTAAYTGFGEHKRPIMEISTARALVDLKRIVPKHSAIFTPFWEFSYPLMEIGEFATYHDGGIHGGMRTTLISKAMMSTRQEDMVSLISYLEEYGFNHLNTQIRKENLSADQMMKLVFSYPAYSLGENVYLLYLAESIWKMDSMSTLATWDFDTKKSSPMGYVELNCSMPKSGIMPCSDGIIDLNRGFMNDGTVNIPLRAALFVNDGYVVGRQDYKLNEGSVTGYYLQVLMKDKKIQMILVADDRLFPTNFNQQYILGNYDRRFFEEVYNNYPVARLLKVKKTGDEVNNRPLQEQPH